MHADDDMRISIRSGALSSFKQWRVYIDEEIRIGGNLVGVRIPPSAPTKFAMMWRGTTGRP
jgi:hypothetical protein